MSTTAITMEELESERAELLPSRETLSARCGCKTAYGNSHSSSSSSSVTQIGQGNTNGGTNYNQVGLANLQVDNNNVNILGLQGVFS